MKAYWGSGGITPRILDLGTRWRWVVSFTARLLYPQGKSPWYLLDRKLGGPHRIFRRGDQEKNSALAGNQTLFVQSIASNLLTELSRSIILKHTHGCRGSSVGIVNRIRYDRRGYDSWHGQRVQTGSGAHPASYPMGIVGLLLRG
jgi:hypothetical protein